MKKYLAILGFLAVTGGFAYLQTSSIASYAANTKMVAAHEGNGTVFSRDTVPGDTGKHKKPGKMKRDTMQWPKDTMPHSLPPR